MRRSNRESSIFEGQMLSVPAFSKWIQILRSSSKNYAEYGSFLPVQDQLLRFFHTAITAKASARVVVFTAPPASGKTHVIALCGSYLQDSGAPTCIVAPNNELKLEFGQELQRVNRASSQQPPVLTLRTYMKKRDQFQFALVDEAHNLRSAIELDSNVVKSIYFEKEDPYFARVLASSMKDRGYVTKELNIESAHDMLEEIRDTRYHNQVSLILKTLSQWRCFCILSDTTCELKFLAADPRERAILSGGRVFLFSATPLDPAELEFYCNISRESIQTYGTAENDFVPKHNVTYLHTSCKTQSEKQRFGVAVLENFKLPALVLINNDACCRMWSRALSGRLGRRVLIIGSGLSYTRRAQIYRRFANQPDGVLVSSSTVYWEGINIRKLGLLIIPDPPFPRPNLLEIAQGRHTQYVRIARRRLVQGMGRIGRSSQQGGVCLLLFRPSALGSFVRSTTKEKAKRLIAKLSQLYSRETRSSS